MGVPVRLNLRIDPAFRPTASQTIWVLTGLVIIGHPVTSFVYWILVLASGILPHDRDAIGPPIFADLVGALILTPPMLALTKLALIFKTGPFRFWSWNRRRPVLSTAWSLALGGPAVGLVLLIGNDLIQPMDWFAYAWCPHRTLVIAWLLVLRGAALSHAAMR